jgi:hypothetical protein
VTGLPKIKENRDQTSKEELLASIRKSDILQTATSIRVHRAYSKRIYAAAEAHDMVLSVETANMEVFIISILFDL